LVFRGDKAGPILPLPKKLLQPDLNLLFLWGAAVVL